MTYFRKLEEIIRGRLEVARTLSSSDWDKPLPTSRLSCFFLICYILDVSLARGLLHFLAFWEPREMHGERWSQCIVVLCGPLQQEPIRREVRPPYFVEFNVSACKSFQRGSRGVNISQGVDSLEDKRVPFWGQLSGGHSEPTSPFNFS